MLTCVEEDYEVLFPLGGPHGRMLKITAHGVNTLEEYCGVPENSLWKWEMQLGKEDDNGDILLAAQAARPVQTSPMKFCFTVYLSRVFFRYDLHIIR
jgi:hypothetical protein